MEAAVDQEKVKVYVEFSKSTTFYPALRQTTAVKHAMNSRNLQIQMFHTMKSEIYARMHIITAMNL